MFFVPHHNCSAKGTKWQVLQLLRDTFIIDYCFRGISRGSRSQGFGSARLVLASGSMIDTSLTLVFDN